MYRYSFKKFKLKIFFLRKIFKIFIINLIILFAFLILTEIICGFARLIIGKNFLIPFSISSRSSDPAAYCNTMKTDVLLSHVPDTQGKCFPKGGKVILGEYVIYDNFNKNRPILMTLGGSTTSGFYQHFSNGETYPKILSKLSEDKYSVLNGGVGGYSSLNNFYKIVRDASRFKNLKTVIQLTGANDIKNYFGFEEDKELYFPFMTDIQFEMNRSQAWINQGIMFNTIFFRNLTPNFASLMSYFFHLKNKRDKNFGKKIDSPDVKEYYKKINNVKRWEQNIKKTNNILKELNIRYYVFLQPLMGISDIQSKAPIGSNDEKLLNNISSEYLFNVRDYYQKLKEICSKIEYCIDISDSVPPLGDVYSDIRHHNEKGNKLLANIIWSNLEKRK